GVTTDDNSLPAFTRELVKDVSRVMPTGKKGNNAGGGRRQSRVEWSLSYQIAKQDHDQITARKAFTATPPERGRNRGRQDVGGMVDNFLNGGLQ
ncbi:MAG TPA: hypothetical protein VH120_16960, partial [Gemmataceae bacterium]|nr:hypothetical protein [Gemmataceae bacterium]